MSTDVLVVGAGVFGLWVARCAAKAGLRVVLIESRRVGAGASGGVLGALTAHAPDRWDDKKEFQLQALAELPRLITELEAETGLSAGYRRCGRVMPIRSAAFAEQVERRREGAKRHWAALDAGFTYQRVASQDAGAEPILGAWLAPDAAPQGYVLDALAARIAPRAYLAALDAALASNGAVERRIGVGYRGWDGDAALLSDGSRLLAGRVVIAAGFESFAMHPALAALGAPDGGVKGRAALFRLPGYEGRPLIYDDGIYVAPHADGMIAVGSTDEKDWAAPGEDAFGAGRRATGDETFVARAAALCSPLAGRAPDEIWAGVRPKARSRDPLIGPVDEGERLWIAGGGFKIGLGVAHRLAAALVDRMTGAASPTLAPQRFWAEEQIAKAQRRG